LSVLVSSSAASQFHLAVLGADSPLAETLFVILDEREVPIGRLFPLVLGEADASATFQGSSWPHQEAAEFDFGQAQALIVTGRGAAVARLVERVRAERPTMPVFDVNAEGALEASPAVIAARVIKPIAALAGLAAAEAFVTLPVAMAGKEGVDELVAQTRGLFNMESPEPEVFPLQIAFNVIPKMQVKGAPDYEMQLAQTTAKLANGALVGFTAVTGPLFFGAAMALHVLTEKALEIELLRNALQRQDGITLMEAAEIGNIPAAMPTPATDAHGSQNVFVGRIQVVGESCRLWLVFDPLALEAAQIATAVENWIDKPVTSMLT
jgi:aspartate-semialdehyde dehydrogenase